MPRETDIWEDILDRVLDSPQADRVINSVTRLFDRVGDAVENAARPTARPRQPAPRPRTRRRPDPLLEHYRTLGVAPGTPMSEVKRAFRELVKQHHPDNFASDPERQRAATVMTARITQAYREIEAAQKA